MSARHPDGSPSLIIGCRQPSAFLRAHAWALQQGYTSVLLAPGDWTRCVDLAQRLGAREVLTDDLAAFAGCGLPLRDARGLGTALPATLASLPHPVAILLTSGSTGEPQPVRKDARAIGGECDLLQALWSTLPALHHVVSTVALEHMFGYTFGCWLPHLAGATLHDQRPLAPADLRRACASAPHPPWIVTTPTHLRAYVLAPEPFPPVAGLICATSALGTELARAAAQRFQVPLLEIYGSTETGAIASRLRPPDEVTPGPWIPLPGVRLMHPAAGTAACTLDHVEGVVELGDLIEPQGKGFQLLGRHGDLVKVCGKRHSLTALNHLLLQVPGVRDGAYYIPEGNGSGKPERAVAFVALQAGHGAVDVVRALRGCIDDVFLPRTVWTLDALPRTDTGKLRTAELARLHRSLRREHPTHDRKDS